MTDYCLRLPDEAAFNALGLVESTTLLIDRIGPIKTFHFGADGAVVIDRDLPEYRVNVRALEPLPADVDAALRAVSITPAVPYRVWA